MIITLPRFSALQRQDVKTGTTIRENQSSKIYSVLDDGKVVATTARTQTVCFTLQQQNNPDSVLTVARPGKPGPVEIKFTNGVNKKFDLLS